MTRRFAQGTTVAPEKSRMEVEKFLQKRGAKSFATMNNDQIFAIQFEIKSGAATRTVRFIVPRATAPKRGTEQQRKRQVDAEERRRWRALLLVMKAKFEAIESGITTFDREFMAHLVTAAGQTVGDVIAPSLERGLAGEGAAFLALPPGGSP